MPSSLTTVFSMSANGGIVVDTIPQFSSTITLAGPGFFENVWNIGTSEETLSPQDITTEGFAFFRNTDSTNFVNIGVTTAVYFARLKADEFMWLRLEPGVTIFGLADTAPVNVWVKIFND